MQPLFSIIIPTLNEEKFLPVLLNNLSEQTIKNFEVIIVDGKSKDKTLKKTIKFQKKLPTLTTLTTATRNVSHQRNLGAKVAKGEYLVFFDADNQIPKDFLQKLSLKLQKQNLSVFTTWCKPDSNKKIDKIVTTFINIGIEASEFLDTGIALGAMIGCKSEDFRKINGFDINLKFGEDADFVRRATKEGGKFKIFRTPLFTWSFRRFEQEGTLKVLRQYALIYLKKLTSSSPITEKDYPMGGHLYEDVQSTQLVKNINKTMKKIIKNPKTLKKIQKTLKKLDLKIK